ncbi:uncharacterized protein LY79DRAFT_560933 [Colletotrichum navitas]|uniref:Uncharacterized protein n=1 Tax=Colletotrichum navitas TaxID=681940 RepID=A0AAD8PVA2_9PEZI|nr:uncharacterized protein LY79DRAFT_560933 [Colletotrichum navitas]KAK1580603.1 hypothetical protein LY79DRAFT_560933 [Colletotrichum navitas]
MAILCCSPPRLHQSPTARPDGPVPRAVSGFPETGSRQASPSLVSCSRINRAVFGM